MGEPPAFGIRYRLTLRESCQCTCSRRRTSGTVRPRCSPLRRIQDQEQTRDATSISRNRCSSRGPTWSTRSYSTRSKNHSSETIKSKVRIIKKTECNHPNIIHTVLSPRGKQTTLCKHPETSTSPHTGTQGMLGERESRKILKDQTLECGKDRRCVTNMISLCF